MAIRLTTKFPNGLRRSPPDFSDGLRRRINSFLLITDPYLSSVKLTFQIGFDAIPITLLVDTKIDGD